MKTRDEVEELKRQRVIDPIFDMPYEGFEEYSDELIVLQQDMERQWAYDKYLRLKKKAESLGATGNIKLAEAWELLEYKLDELKAKVYRLENAE